jgi:hypothetical protein
MQRPKQHWMNFSAPPQESCRRRADTMAMCLQIGCRSTAASLCRGPDQQRRGFHPRVGAAADSQTRRSLVVAVPLLHSVGQTQLPLIPPASGSSSHTLTHTLQRSHVCAYIPAIFFFVCWETCRAPSLSQSPVKRSLPQQLRGEQRENGENRENRGDEKHAGRKPQQRMYARVR